jgi:hypothetical protein
MHINRIDYVNGILRELKSQVKEKKVLDNINTCATGLSLSAKKQIKRVNDLIDVAWEKTKKKPNFVKKINNDKKIALEPIYTNEKRIALQIESPDYTQKITIDERGTNFTYEKIVKTEFGSATTKSYNSKLLKKDVETTQLVNNLLEENLPEIFLSNNIIK